MLSKTWVKFNDLIHLRDNLRDELVKFHDKPSPEQYVRVNHAIAVTIECLTGLHHQFCTAAPDEVKPVNSTLDYIIRGGRR